VKSAAKTAGCCAGLGCFTAHAPSPRTTLAHVGAHGELWRRGWVSWQVAGSAGSPSTPQVGEARWRGARQGDRTVACIPPPTPARGGEECSRSSVRVGRGGPSPTRVSSRLTRVSSRLTRVSSRLTRVSSRLARVSSRLMRVSSRLSRVSSRLTRVSSRLKRG
jgi:hypothetical protein